MSSSHDREVLDSLLAWRQSPEWAVMRASRAAALQAYRAPPIAPSSVHGPTRAHLGPRDSNA
jgi:hypothetical protein